MGYASAQTNKKVEARKPAPKKPAPKKSNSTDDVLRTADAAAQTAGAVIGLANAFKLTPEQRFAKASKGAADGDAKAQLDLGRCYHEGIGVEADPAMAFECYRKAALARNADAQYCLAECYETGLGVEASISEALLWYMRAADQGLVRAMLHVAQCFEYGNGVAMNVPVAMAWYMRAAEKKDKNAAKIVEEFKRRGIQPDNNMPDLGNQVAVAAPSMAVITLSDVDENIPSISAVNDKTFAVIIATETYQREAAVPYALPAGQVFAEDCTKTLGIPESNIHVVRNATLNDINYEVDWITKVMTAYNGEARVIFYYAGHGIPDEANKAAFILPVDGYGTSVATGFALNSLYDRLGGIPSRGVTVLLDACFSGAKREGDMLASARGVAIKVRPDTPQGNLVVFSAAQGDETAFPYRAKGHGMFTYFLLKKLQETKGDVNLRDLGDYVTREVSQRSIIHNGKPQTPSVVPGGPAGNDWQRWHLAR